MVHRRAGDTVHQVPGRRHRRGRSGRQPDHRAGRCAALDRWDLGRSTGKAV